MELCSRDFEGIIMYYFLSFFFVIAFILFLCGISVAIFTRRVHQHVQEKWMGPIYSIYAKVLRLSEDEVALKFKTQIVRLTSFWATRISGIIIASWGILGMYAVVITWIRY